MESLSLRELSNANIAQIQALKAAYEFWEKSKFEIISQKVSLVLA